MKITTKATSAKLAKVELACILVLEGKKPELPGGVTAATKSALAGFEAGFRKTRLVDTTGSAQRVLLVGLGKAADLDAERLRRAAAIAIKRARAEDVGSAALVASDSIAKACGDPLELGTALAEGARMGAYAYREFKSKKDDKKVGSFALVGTGAKFKAGARRGLALAAANCFTRDLQNAPGNKMRPRDLARAARALARKSPRIRCKVLDERAMAGLKMEALLGVSRGSSEPAQLIHLTYRPAKKAKRRIAIVGKGLTFDAGGISIKPSGKMWDMKYDMSGGAAVLGAFHALTELDVPVEVHGIVPASENLLGASAQKPGDVVTAMNGTTIEVLNTDAEGRLILADALCYTTKKVQPDAIVDLATLTGAVIVALGHELGGMITRDDDLAASLRAAGEATGEALWPLPLLDCHLDQMKGEVADLKNINSGEGNGSTTGAAFLASFVGDTPWCHLDIAGTAWGQKARDYVGGAQGSGFGARLLMRWLESQ